MGRWTRSAVACAAASLLAACLVPIAGVAPPASASSLAASVSAGGRDTCASSTSGALKCWGDNNLGQLGANSGVTQSPTPVAVVGSSSGVAAVSVGGYHTCLVTASGGAKCWGNDYYGELGDGRGGSGNYASYPIDVIGLASGVLAISAGEDHTCALTSAGGVKCWGFNGDGQLGNGTTQDHDIPVGVVGLARGVVAISAGGHHTCALTTAGGVKCWGSNNAGQLGDGSTTSSSVPVNVSGLSSDVAAISAGLYQHTCALTTSGGVKCWGNNAYGQVGDGTTTTRLTPVFAVGMTSGIDAVDAGGYHTCAVTSGGAATCWGANSAGQIGDGSRLSRHSPVGVSGLASGVTAISAGMWHTCAVLSDGSLRCWGWNGSGQIGDGTTTDRSTPVPVSLDRFPPGPPTNVVVHAADGALVLTYDAPNETGTTPIARYDGECYSTDGLYDAFGFSTSTVMDIAGAQDGESYYCFVHATNTEGLPGDSTRSSNTATPKPTASLGGATFYEGDVGSRTYQIPVTLSRPTTQTVTLSYTVYKAAGDTATAGTDFIAATGTLALSPTISSDASNITPTVTYVPVTMKGDTTVEPNETFSVSITSASNAAIAHNPYRPTIYNDDAQSGIKVYATNAAIVEGSQAATFHGVNTLKIHVSLSRPVPSGRTVTVKYTVTGVTATSCSTFVTGCDFLKPSNAVTLTFTAGQNDKTLNFGVVPETTYESDETFKVTLSSAVGATIRAAFAGVGTIVNDD